MNKWRKKICKNLFSQRQFYTIFEQMFSNLRPLLSITFPLKFQKSKKFGHWTSGSEGKKTVIRSEKHRYQEKSCSVRQNLQKKNIFWRGDFKPFICKSFQIWDHFLPLLFPKDSESLKIWDIRLREVGAKRRLNSTSKVNTQKSPISQGRGLQLFNTSLTLKLGAL